MLVSGLDKNVCACAYLSVNYAGKHLRYTKKIYIVYGSQMQNCN